MATQVIDGLFLVDDVTGAIVGNVNGKGQAIKNIYATIADFNNAGGSAAYGVGPVWIAGVLYWCDGVVISAVGVGSRLVNVASRCQINTAQAAGSWWTDGCTLHQAQDDITALKPIHAGWYSLSGVGVDTAITAAATIECAIEYPAGVITRVTYGGNNVGVIPAGGNTSPDWCNVSIPKGAIFGVRAYGVFPNGLAYIGAALNATISGISQGATNQNTILANNIMNGAYSYSGKGGGALGCVALLSNSSVRSCLLVGDSITYGGSGAYVDQLDSACRFGLVERALPNAATINCGVGGTGALQTLSNYSMRMNLAQYCTDIVHGYGTNNWAGGSNAAALIAGTNTFLNTYATGKKLTVWTLPPSYLTGTFTTVGGQTLHANNQLRIDYNNLLLTGGITFPGAVIKDVNAVLSSAYDASTLKVLPVGQALTGDGTHPNRLACQYLAANLSL